MLLTLKDLHDLSILQCHDSLGVMYMGSSSFQYPSSRHIRGMAKQVEASTSAKVSILFEA